MSGTTRTGLVPTPKRHVRFMKKRKTHGEIGRMPLRFEAVPMPLSLRPFGGLFNPFAKGCSVLCNHPAPTAVKDVIHQLKTLAIDGKSAGIRQEKQLTPHEADNIPEDLVRRYADTDSRPLTPTPTVTSVHTRTSAGSFLNRRCITPEWGKHESTKRKKIILDLRRSHSQETLYWKPNSELTQSGIEEDQKKPKSAGANEEKKSRQPKGEDQRPKSSLGTAQAQGQPTASSPSPELEPKAPKTCINEHDLSDEDVRRGKKRKKLKPQQATTTFHLSEDPETQVAALGPDSLNPSTRPSLIPNSISLLPIKDKSESEPILLKGSFLTDEAFQALKTDLDVDLIENTFGRYLNRALREAIKYMPSKPKVVQKPTEEVDKSNGGSETKSKMPRKFSKSATRFDVPMNLEMLKTMSPLDYLSKYVWVSQQRKQLYKRVFLKYLSREEVESEVVELLPGDKIPNNEDEQLPRNEYKERIMMWQSLPQALEDVLEFHGTEENVRKTLEMIGYEATTSTRVGELDFRTWCGIVSFAERLALADPTCTDSCDELEKADFCSMEQQLLTPIYKVPRKLREIFKVIRSTHNLPFN